MTQKYLAIIFLFLIGCKPIEPVNFVEVQNVKINSSTDNQINISAEIVLDNPNKVKITTKVIFMTPATSNIAIKNQQQNTQ